MTQLPALPDLALLQRFDVSSPRFVVQTDLATLWQVTRADNTCAALKIYHGSGIADEVAGMDLLTAWDGQGAVRVYARSDRAILLEWLDGASLGDLSRDGDDARATRALAEVANRLHRAAITPPKSLVPLEQRFQALLTARFADDCPAPTKESLRTSAALAETLLARQSDMRPLHGDLHHDNIKGSARGDLAFDPKGILGDRLYEVANAMRNPVGAKALYTSAAVIACRADILAEVFRADRRVLLQWAAAQAGLSLAWSHHSRFDAAAAEDAKLIDALLSAID